MNFVYYPDLPSLPEIPLNPSPESYHQYLTGDCKKNNKAISNCVCTRYTVNPELVEWTRENIDSTIEENIGLNHHGSPGGVAIPHTDRTRNWNLMWILDLGGENVETVFWQEKGFEIHREAKCYPKTYDNLIELERHVLNPNQWVLIDATVVHSVENIQTIRKSIQIGFWNNSPFVNKHIKNL